MAHSHAMVGNGLFGRNRWRVLRLLAAACVVQAGPACAAPSGLFGPDTISLVADVRVAGADGERSWTDGGFGKTRFGGGDDAEGDFRMRAAATEASLAWQPQLAWDLTGTIVAAAQHEQDEPVDLVEAFLTYKPVPSGGVRLSARAGLFWPAISLEHEGAAWSVADMITPSAINSWIGEEVKVIGAEAMLSGETGGNRLSATLGLFGFNDTAGTLLAFRGWALHDLKAGAFGHQRLPLLNPFMQNAQAPTTKPLIELDGRPGFYGKFAWQLAAPVVLEAFYYDNRGDPSVKRNGQWGWDTRFLNLGAGVDFGSRTRLFAQAVSGTTEMGIESADGYWVETRYRAAYLRLSHDRGPVTLSGRAELFGTDERGTKMSDEEDEHGWSAAAAARWPLSDRSALLVEALHVDSRRGARLREGLTPRQTQTLVQAALRLTL